MSFTGGPLIPMAAWNAFSGDPARGSKEPAKKKPGQQITDALATLPTAAFTVPDYVPDSDRSRALDLAQRRDQAQAAQAQIDQQMAAYNPPDVAEPGFTPPPQPHMDQRSTLAQALVGLLVPHLAAPIGAGIGQQYQNMREDYTQQEALAEKQYEVRARQAQAERTAQEQRFANLTRRGQAAEAVTRDSENELQKFLEGERKAHQKDYGLSLLAQKQDWAHNLALKAFDEKKSNDLAKIGVSRERIADEVTRTHNQLVMAGWRNSTALLVADKHTSVSLEIARLHARQADVNARLQHADRRDRLTLDRDKTAITNKLGMLRSAQSGYDTAIAALSRAPDDPNLKAQLNAAITKLNAAANLVKSDNDAILKPGAIYDAAQDEALSTAESANASGTGPAVVQNFYGATAPPGQTGTGQQGVAPSAPPPQAKPPAAPPPSSGAAQFGVDPGLWKRWEQQFRSGPQGQVAVVKQWKAMKIPKERAKAMEQALTGEASGPPFPGPR